ncbi:SsgA family sporulation/cell division regulator [Streptomyces sp. SP18CS02]|uniref:SsgA family sporulation/cell division regulator n=1 Tax=Streptomyces sp. SP18CS02 TaxID=3002531 RepID=UPI002E794F94|nr:SsgA family sporulation/cell division regulator [Streptomyces sp. SP18CS02]MEE1753574.1 SsgA family sporulation/cell division regulator [Streptomyces sp. SP18CS02]
MNAVMREKVFMRLLSQSGHELPVLVRMTYDDQDPYAVGVGFTHDGCVYAEWRLDRGMLREGMRHPVGVGDVRMWPVLKGTREELCIELRGPDLEDEVNHAVFTVWAPSMARFLDRTYEMVPEGRERLALDEFLAQVLATG